MKLDPLGFDNLADLFRNYIEKIPIYEIITDYYF